VAAKIGYARVSTARSRTRNYNSTPSPTKTCLKVCTDRASGTKAERPPWNLCLADLRAGDTLITAPVVVRLWGRVGVWWP
jgi:DNA invertase Pin-like site-specific DNA recombinase